MKKNAKTCLKALIYSVGLYQPKQIKVITNKWVVLISREYYNL